MATTYPGAELFMPADADLRQLADAAQQCHGCDLYEEATQTVFGEGPAGARLVLVGETPGDQEDLAGRPFVGPAGQLLRRALAEVGIDESTTYVTNAVKHFRFTQRGQRRIHEKPTVTQIRACTPWMRAELGLVPATVVVALGATAAQAIMGSAFRVTRQRGEVLDLPDNLRAGARFVATVHPSSILRSDRYDEEYAGFVADLRVAVDALG